MVTTVAVALATNAMREKVTVMMMKIVCLGIVETITVVVHREILIHLMTVAKVSTIDVYPLIIVPYSQFSCLIFPFFALYQGIHCVGQGGCCSRNSPCKAGEGDCDHDLECGVGLVCGTNNCKTGTFPLFSDQDDCCKKRATFTI